jgi:hypothetical protein
MSVVMMEAVSTSETSVNLHQTTHRNIPEDSSSCSSPWEPEISPVVGLLTFTHNLHTISVCRKQKLRTELRLKNLSEDYSGDQGVGERMILKTKAWKIDCYGENWTAQCKGKCHGRACVCIRQAAVEVCTGPGLALGLRPGPRAGSGRVRAWFKL